MAENEITPAKKLFVIGGSSGSLDALLAMLPLLDKGLAVPIVIVMHRGTGADNGMAELLAVKTTLQVKEADEKDNLLAGWIYIAPADYHLLIEDDETISLDASEKINYCRPSIDVTFASAAAAYGHSLTAVLLSGANADGAAAMKVVKNYGGRNIVQDPEEAIVDYMPRQALMAAIVDDVLPAEKIATLLNTIAHNNET